MGHELETEHLSLDFLRVCEAAAIAAARTMGQGDRKYSDHVAVEAMREVMDSVPMRGRIVIGEGERDEAPMLYIGEEVGAGARHNNNEPDGDIHPEVDIAVDPLEGTNLCALGANNAIAVLAASERDGLLNAPDIYMDKVVVGPSCRGAIDLDAPVKDNLKNIARRLGRDVEDLTVIVLDRPRHKKLIQDVRAAGARIRLIGDGDLSAGISAAVAGTNIHALMGIGGAPEGVLTAAALKCLNGEIQARLCFDPDKLGMDRDKVPPADVVVSRLREMGIDNPQKIYDTNDLAPGKKIIFAATGVTDGALLKGVRFFGAGKRTHSLIMTTESRHIRFVDTVHVEGGPDTVIRF
ncbi:MAG: class II fructose-bisphosphatase [Pyrinomonadaceae bacterium]